MFMGMFDATRDEIRQSVLYSSGRSYNQLPYGFEHYPGHKIVSRGLRNQSQPSSIRRALQRSALADIPHGLKNMQQILSARFVYGHVERDYLTAAFALKTGRNYRTKLLGQTVWLFEDLVSFSPRRRRYIERLLARVDIFVHNSLQNYKRAQELLPESRHEYVPFGVSPAFQRIERSPKPQHILAVGNDRARDWETLATATNHIEVPLQIATYKSSPDIEAMRQRHNTQIFHTSSNAELAKKYSNSVCLLVVTKPNLHASGITAMLEAAAAGTPVIATRDPSLLEYFPEDAVLYVDPRHPDELREAINYLVHSPAFRMQIASRAKKVIEEKELDAVGYWNRISRLCEPRPSISKSGPY
jgi:glycosyltransferase involved in cell wall biosynthesis